MNNNDPMARQTGGPTSSDTVFNAGDSKGTVHNQFQADDVNRQTNHRISAAPDLGALFKATQYDRSVSKEYTEYIDKIREDVKRPSAISDFINFHTVSAPAGTCIFEMFGMGIAIISREQATSENLISRDNNYNTSYMGHNNKNVGLPSTYAINALQDSVNSEFPKIDIWSTQIISMEDYPKAEVMADIIISAFNTLYYNLLSVGVPITKTTSFKELAGAPSFNISELLYYKNGPNFENNIATIKTDISEVTDFAKKTTPTKRIRRLDFGIKSDGFVQSNRQDGMSIREPFTLGMIGGYTDFVASTMEEIIDSNGRSSTIIIKWRPVIHITTINSTLNTANVIPFLIIPFFNAFIKEKEWAKHYSKFTPIAPKAKNTLFEERGEEVLSVKFDIRNLIDPLVIAHHPHLEDVLKNETGRENLLNGIIGLQKRDGLYLHGRQNIVADDALFEVPILVLDIVEGANTILGLGTNVKNDERSSIINNSIISSFESLLKNVSLTNEVAINNLLNELSRTEFLMTNDKWEAAQGYSFLENHPNTPMDTRSWDYATTNLFINDLPAEIKSAIAISTVSENNIKKLEFLNDMANNIKFDWREVVASYPINRRWIQLMADLFNYVGYTINQPDSSSLRHNENLGSLTGSAYEQGYDHIGRLNKTNSFNNRGNSKHFTSYNSSFRFGK